MTSLAIFDTAILMGFNAQGQCVYSAKMPLSEYWDVEHPWDDDQEVLALKLVKVKGYLFDDEAALMQEFESHFHPQTGLFSGGWAKDEDGVVEHHHEGI